MGHMFRSIHRASLIVGILVAISLRISAGDWPQYRGANHDSSTPERISTTWPAEGPRALWRVPLNGGFSSITIGGGKAFTLVKRNVEGAEREVCLALDANTGKEIWAAPLAVAKYQDGGNNGAPDNNGGDGPRSTPSYDDGRVYAFSSRLVLFCLYANTGKEVWKRDLIKENAGRIISWENAASPLIDGDLIFVAGGGAGQSLIAINKKDGRVAWQGQDDMMTHSTPTAATIQGQRQVIFFTQRGLVSVVPQTGAVLWRQRFNYNVSTAMTPVVGGDIVFCSAGYSIGGGAYKITKTGNSFSVNELWFKPGNVLNNHWSTPLAKDGLLYGLFGFKEFANAPLKCVDLASGNVLWSQAGFGPGVTILADGCLVVLGDAGQLAIVKATPERYTELARARVLTGKCWSTPTVSNGRIYARSTKEGVCLEVSPQVIDASKSGNAAGGNSIVQ